MFSGWEEVEGLAVAEEDCFLGFADYELSPVAEFVAFCGIFLVDVPPGENVIRVDAVVPLYDLNNCHENNTVLMYKDCWNM